MVSHYEAHKAWSPHALCAMDIVHSIDFVDKQSFRANDEYTHSAARSALLPTHVMALEWHSLCCVAKPTTQVHL